MRHGAQTTSAMLLVSSSYGLYELCFPDAISATHCSRSAWKMPRGREASGAATPPCGMQKVCRWPIFSGYHSGIMLSCYYIDPYQENAARVLRAAPVPGRGAALGGMVCSGQ